MNEIKKLHLIRTRSAQKAALDLEVIRKTANAARDQKECVIRNVIQKLHVIRT
jgi:hypothetical protein